jgi:D-inositol-3-phosphate glycosyltransferase
MKQLVSRTATNDDPPRRSIIEKALMKKAHGIMTTSDNDQLYLSTLYDIDNTKLTTIPPGVDTTLFYAKDKAQAKRTIGADPNHHIVLAVGRIDPVKGFDVLLYAIKILFGKYKTLQDNVCVWIVGGDIEESESMWSAELKKLTTLQKTLGLSSTVKFIPAQPQEKLVDYYNAAEVVVMPSHYESFGMVALEALACDTPVITTDVMGISPMVKHMPKGHVVSANNPVLLSEQLHHVLREHHVAHHAETVGTCDWDCVATSVGEYYTKIIENR